MWVAMCWRYGKIVHVSLRAGCVVLQGYDISFLVTNFHTEMMYKHKLVDFIVQVCGSRSTHTRAARRCSITHTTVIWGEEGRGGAEV
jgi:hypothetical protein